MHLNTRLLLSATENLSDYMARKRPSDRTNNIAFLTLHLIEGRHYLLRLLGEASENPFSDLVDGVERIEQVPALPPLEMMRSAWRMVTGRLVDRLEAMTTDELTATAAAGFPIDDPTLLGGIAFLLQHESYHIGQIALLRKFFGLPAVQYA
ncbi:MAG: DinB family protein [Acidobacteriota bacterium]